MADQQKKPMTAEERAREVAELTSAPKMTATTAAAVQRKREGRGRRRVTTTILLVLLALIGISFASFAWFTISDNARSQNLRLDVTGDNLLRFDLDAHDTFEEYVKTLGFAAIGARMQRDEGFDVTTSNLTPVTTSDYSTFTYEDGTVATVSSGAYLEFTLHFMSKDGCLVHLTSADSTDGASGTKFASTIANLPQAMRMSFTTDGQTWVYDPNLGATSTTSGTITTFGLPNSANMVVDNTNAMFSLEAQVDKPVVVRIWMEGTDPLCTNELKGGDYSVSMRFEGTKVSTGA